MKSEEKEVQEMPTSVARDGLENFGAYRKALELFDLVVEDMRQVRQDPLCVRLAGQQIEAADSICSNMEEGYGRRSREEYTQFLVISRGSTREVMGRYGRMRHWLPPEVITDRVGRCDEINRILSRSINTLRKAGASA